MTTNTTQLSVDLTLLLLSLGRVPANEDDARHLADLRGSWKRIDHLARGFYTNLADPDTTAAVIHDNYGPNFPRLSALKAKYDPMNLFRLNANVPPKV